MTNQEAIRFLEISKEYMPEEKLREFILRLDQEFTTNNPFKQSLNVIRSILEPPPPIPRWVKPTLYAVIVGHFILVCCIVTSFFVLPFFAPWYIATPLMLFIWWFSTTKNIECKLTNFENKLRKKLGMKQIGGFVGHYFKKPIRIAWKKLGL